MAMEFIKGLQALCRESGERLRGTILMMESLMAHGMNPWFSATILYHLVQGCIESKDLGAARLLHSIAMKRTNALDSFLGSHLIRMYALCNRLKEADAVFYTVSSPDAYAWTALILAHSKLGSSRYVIDLFSQLQSSAASPGEHIYISVLKACSNTVSLHEGMLVHCHLVENGFDPNVTVCNMLISMYCTCGCLVDACQVFEKMSQLSVVTWNAMILGYTMHDCAPAALRLYYQMRHGGKIKPDDITMVTILKACSMIPAFDCGKEVYSYYIEGGGTAMEELNVANALIDMFSKCGDMEDAVWLFNNARREDVVTWSAVIAGYVQSGCSEAAIELFDRMLREGIEPDSVAFASIVQAASGLEDICQGKVLHAFVVSDGDELDAFLGSTLINMYSKTGCLEDARSMFKGLKQLNNVVTWSALITGYAQNGHGKEVLKLFMQMQEQHIVPNTTTFVCILTTCAEEMLLDEGKLVHDYIVGNDHGLDASAGSALVDMYVKCGCLEDASAMLKRLPERSISTWTTLISGYAQHNDYLSALKLLDAMQKEGLKPNIITYISLIAACSRIGLVDDGCHYFNAVTQDLSGSPMHEHYNCVIDLFGRAGLLDEADVIQKTLPFEPDFAACMSLLSHCKVHGDGDLARQCFQSASLQV